MLSELVAVAGRFAEAGELAPPATKPRRPMWVIEVDAAGRGRLHGPYRRDEHRALLAPFRGDRAGKISEQNLKPYLLMDDGRYVLGIPETGKDEVATLAHSGFVRLVELAAQRTGDPNLGQVLAFLRQPVPDEFRNRIGPGDDVTFRTVEGDYLVDREAIRQFWAEYLAEDLIAPDPAMCAVCGERGAILQLMPGEIVVMGQKCQITSFNLAAFTSFGKEQTTNAPVCYRCASAAVSALNHLIRSPQHHATAAREIGKGQPHPIRNQLAVFWLREPARETNSELTIDWEAAMTAVLEEPRPQEDADTPPPDLAQVDALVRLPWTSDDRVMRLSENSFHLAVLSANKTRLVVRDWIVISLADLKDNLRAFLQAQRIVGPMGESARAFPIAALTEALETTDPGDTRGLLRCAYLGQRPPSGLQLLAVRRFQNVLLSGKAHNRSSYPNDTVRVREQLRVLHNLAATLKLTLTHRKEAARMEILDPGHEPPAYACGRLLAVLEEAQRRASRGRLNTTLVDRFYGAVSTAPAATFGSLISQTETAHLPKIRREQRGYDQLRRVLEEVMSHFDKARGLPRILPPDQQADFALGFYQQRAAFRRPQEGSEA